MAVPSPTSQADRISPALTDRYRIERELGRGGMGAVYLATDLRLDRPVALKILPPEFAHDTALRERFLRETRTAASFSHPNIVPVHAVEDDGDTLAFAMGYVEGESLAARVARAGPLDVRTIVRLLLDVAYALAYAHGRGVVHRDSKPDNIMIERATGRALVMDFGIARAIAPTAAAPGLTRIGEIVGTPEYMSPEQASGDHVDGRSDLYSLGLVALFAATGHAPVTGDSAQQLIVKQLTEILPPAASLRADLPSALAAAIDSCVAKEPSARFASAESLVEAIDAAQLAAPAIPLEVRLFAQDLGMLVMLGIFGLMILLVSASNVSNASENVVGLLPLMALVGAGVARLLDLRATSRRLGGAGFAWDDIVAGMQAVLDERALARAVGVTGPSAIARRKRMVGFAIAGLVVAALLFRATRGMRTQLAAGKMTLGLPAFLILFVGVSLAGASIFVIIRNPARTPPNDRILKRVWMGAVGRWCFASAVRAGLGAGGAEARTATGPRGVATPQTPRAVTARAPGVSVPARTRAEPPDVRTARGEGLVVCLSFG